MTRKMPLERIGVLLHTTLLELKEMGSEARSRDLFNSVESKLTLMRLKNNQL